MKVLTLTFQDRSTVEVHMLNPGEHFEGFGGSSRGLTVSRKTASLITRRSSAMGIVDTELDIHDKSFWRTIARLIDGQEAIARADEVTP